MFACGRAPAGAHDAGGDAAADAASDAATPNPAGTIGRYEAEDGVLVGGAAIVGAADHSDRAIGDVAGEASGRRAVTLAATGDGVAFVVRSGDGGANAVVVRYSIPDAPAGGGTTAPLELVATGPDGAPLATATLTLTSRYAWVYGSVAAGTKLYNVPANAQTNDGAANPIHIYDEVQLLLAAPLPANTTITLTSPSAAVPITLDFLELEIVAPSLAQPAALLSITDPRCGAIALDTNHTGRVFDGGDDASYASVFVAVVGINPFNPTNADGTQPAGTQEKDYYTSGPGDVLQDALATAASANLSMFDLADHNFQAMQACVAAVTTAGSGFTGIWIPPGRFYARGSLVVPSGLAIRGAGMWYAKLVAVDTAAPTAVTNPANGISGIASTSGDFRFVATPTGSSDVAISDLAMFGNETQRDHVDRASPIGVSGEFATSQLARLWVEHYSQGMVINAASTGDMLSELRVRDTFADGIDLFGETSNTSIASSHTRGTGDDGFAIWSQSATSASIGNSLTGSVSELSWFGDGYGIYGGANITLDSLVAIDSLTGAGIKLSTEFVPTTLPASFVMTGVSLSNATLVRCGGDAFGSETGALLIGPEDEAISGMSVDHVTIEDPTFAAIDVRVLSNVGKIVTPGTLDVTIANTNVIGAAGCAAIAASISGSGSLDNACACAVAGGAASTCAVANASATTFTVASTCAETTCPP